MKQEPTYNITFAIEAVTPEFILDELEPLILENHAELDDPDEPLDPNYDIYVTMYQTGNLKCLSVRDEGDLVGYAVILLSEDMRNISRTVAAIDILYLTEQYRRYDVSRRFFSFIHKVLKQNDVASYNISVRKDKRDFSKLLERLSFTELETVYTKRI